MALFHDAIRELRKKAQSGFKGYPVATVAYYGPDDTRATKVAVGIVARGDKVLLMETWLSETADVRNDPTVTGSVLDFIKAHKARSVAMTEKIIGCPHEEGTDYPEGSTCPRCPFWADRDRWTGRVTR